MSKINFIVIAIAIVAAYGCGSSGPSNTNSNSNTNTRPVEIKIDPANMPEGLSTTPLPLPSSGKLPEGISINAVTPSPGRIPGIPTAEQLRKGIKKGTTPTPGIPDPETIRKQLGYPATNVNVPSKGPIMMKSNRKLGGRPQ